MTIKALAHSAQQHLHASTGGSFKRTHVYELLAAAFGFNSYAAFRNDSVFTELRPHSRRIPLQGEVIRRRCCELEYEADLAARAPAALTAFLEGKQVGIASLSSLVGCLRGGEPTVDDDLDGRVDELSDEDEFGPLLRDSLEDAAGNDKALAHYALALLHAPREDDEPPAGSAYWYMQAQQGRILTGSQQQFADDHAARLARPVKHERHLREAARLGNQEALLDLAAFFDEPAFFERECDDVDVDPADVAAIAASMGRATDAARWLTRAAESGDTQAMRELIENYDHDDLRRCWTWLYLAQLLGTDLTQDEYCASHEDGSAYDDDAGGPVHLAGGEGVRLEPLGPVQNAAARRAARELFARIERED